MARIAIINQFYAPDISPTAHLAESLAEHLAGHGHEITVVASTGGYTGENEHSRPQDRTQTTGPRVYRIWTPRFGKATVLKRVLDYSCFYIGALWRVLTLSRQDVIISLTTPPYIAWCGAAHKLIHPSSRLVLWNMDCYPELAERSEKLREFGAVASVMRFLNRALFRRLDHLIGLDTAMIELLMSQYAPRGRELPTTIIPNWEPSSLFPSDKAHEPWSRTAELGLEGRFVVLYLGNMGYGHRFETVIDAADQLRDDPVTFLFIGGGTRWEMVATEKKARQLDNIILHEYVPKEETPSVMMSAGCALITLRDRILGVMSPSKLHSNLAMGLPILYVGPEKSNVDDAIKRFDCGASFRHGDVDNLVRSIREMMADPKRLAQLSGNARSGFDSAYCDSQTLPQFDQIIAALAPTACADTATAH